MTLEQRVARLIALLDRAVSILDPAGLGKDRWANWLLTDAERLRRGDLGGAEHVLGAFGGMGSLSDDAAVKSETVDGDLFGEIYDLAREVRREARRRRLL